MMHNLVNEVNAHVCACTHTYTYIHKYVHTYYITYIHIYTHVRVQELLGDVISRVIRRSPRSTHYRLLVPNAGTIGLPNTLGGVPLTLSLSELGYTDGSDFRVVGMSVCVINVFGVSICVCLPCFFYIR
jgi:hypothetical protein